MTVEFRFRLLPHLLALAVVGVALGHAVVNAQAPAAAADTGKGAVVGTGTFTAFVENMDRSLAFYRDAFGMEVPALPAGGERPYNQTNPQLFAMFDIAGARERHQSARVAGSRVSIELMEIQDVEHRTIALRAQDPGNATLVLMARDLDAVMARARKAGASVVTTGGAPVTLGDGVRAVLLRDIDGRLVELGQTPAPAPAPTTTADIIDMRLSITVNDLVQTVRVYRDILGFSATAEAAFRADKAMQTLTGLAASQVRRGQVQAPGSMLWIEFVEFKGVDRTPLRMRIQDRGAARLQVRAQNIDALVTSIKDAGLKVVSAGAVAVPIPPNFKGALVADPNNFFLTPFAPCDNCAPGIRAPAR
jgi:catechol 2,3-dioxygenase-like lactoylglutathione lyase family enzyme